MEEEKYKMFYETEENETNLRILGENFVKNNKNKGKLIFNNQKRALKDIIEVNIFPNQIKIKLILNKNIANKSEMFKDCNCLIRFSIMDDDNVENIKDKYNEYIENFKEEKSFDNNIKDYYDFIFNEIEKNRNKDISKIFSLNNKLEGIKDNEKILTGIFSDYSLLSPLIYPSKIYNNYINMEQMFFNCKSLLSLPSISKWYSNNILNISKLFYNCKSLISLPDLSIWNTNQVINMDRTFFFT